MKPGQKVSVITSKHADINEGDKGEVVESIGGGYSVRITKEFMFRGVAKDIKSKETREIWFKKEELKLA